MILPSSGCAKTSIIEDEDLGFMVFLTFSLVADDRSRNTFKWDLDWMLFHICPNKDLVSIIGNIILCEI